jgi:heme A synthase
VVLLVGIGLFAVSDFFTPEGAWRAISDSLMVALIFGAMAGWVRANRAALAQIDEPACERPPLEIRYVTSERPRLWRAKAERRRRERVRLKGARDASPGPETT